MSTLSTKPTAPEPQHAAFPNLKLRTPEDVQAFARQLLGTPKELDHLLPKFDPTLPLNPPPPRRKPAHASTSKPKRAPDEPAPKREPRAETEPRRTPVPRIGFPQRLIDVIYDYLDPAKSVVDLCIDYEVDPDQLEALIQSPKAQAHLSALHRLKQARAQTLAEHARADAQATLHRIATDDGARTESKRMAANTILRTTPPAPTVPTPPTPPTPSTPLTRAPSAGGTGLPTGAGNRTQLDPKADAPTQASNQSSPPTTPNTQQKPESHDPHSEDSNTPPKVNAVESANTPNHPTDHAPTPTHAAHAPHHQSGDRCHLQQSPPLEPATP